MNRRHLQLLFLLNPLATFRFGLKLRSFKMLVMRRSRVIVRGSMDLGGLLVLGNTWGHPPFKRTQLTMAKGGWFRTKGNVKIFEGSEIRITKTGKLTINSGFLNECCTIECFHEITIGHNANIARNVIIRDSDGHHLSDRSGNSGVIAIGDNVWIGMNSIILKNVRIGDGAVVAAGSVVNRDVGAGTLVAGVPARFVRNVAWS